MVTFKDRSIYAWSWTWFLKSFENAASLCGWWGRGLLHTLSVFAGTPSPLGICMLWEQIKTTIIVGKSGFHYKKDPKIVYGAKRWQTYVRTGSIYLCGFLSSQYNWEALRIYFWGKLVRLDCRDWSSRCSPNFMDRVVGGGERHPCWTSFSYLNIDCVKPLKWSEC